MLTNWRVRNLTTVAAVGGALILGVTAPVRAAVVTYTLKYAELTNDDAVTGCYEFDSSENEKTQDNTTVCANENVIHQIIQNKAPRYAGQGASGLKKPKAKTNSNHNNNHIIRNVNHPGDPNPVWRHEQGDNHHEIVTHKPNPRGGLGRSRRSIHDHNDQHRD